MCKAPKPPREKEPDQLEFLHNPYLDAELGGSRLVSQLRAGRSSLRINLVNNNGLAPTGPTPIAPRDQIRSQPLNRTGGLPRIGSGRNSGLNERNTESLRELR